MCIPHTHFCTGDEKQAPAHGVQTLIEAFQPPNLINFQFLKLVMTVALGCFFFCFFLHLGPALQTDAVCSFLTWTSVCFLSV